MILISKTKTFYRRLKWKYFIFWDFYKEFLLLTVRDSSRPYSFRICFTSSFECPLSPVRYETMARVSTLKVHSTYDRLHSNTPPHYFKNSYSRESKCTQRSLNVTYSFLRLHLRVLFKFWGFLHATYPSLSKWCYFL